MNQHSLNTENPRRRRHTYKSDGIPQICQRKHRKSQHGKPQFVFTGKKICKHNGILELLGEDTVARVSAPSVASHALGWAIRRMRDAKSSQHLHTPETRYLHIIDKHSMRYHNALRFKMQLQSFCAKQFKCVL